MPKARMNRFDLINRGMNGGLQARLDEFKAEGLSMRQMAESLAEDGFGVSRTTILRWLQSDPQTPAYTPQKGREP